MKNLYSIMTDKPSRLRYNLSNELVLTKEYYNDYGKIDNQNIYIINDEKPKANDWVYHKILKSVFKLDLREVTQDYIDEAKNIKKTILTTDQDLIKDGVQAIDDEFLEWFVKNPSCEEVKWSAYPMSPNGNLVATNRPYPFEGLISNFKIKYKIIIPKEEPNPFELPKSLPDNVFHESLEPKQETLEEFALRNSRYINHTNINHSKQEAIILGGKWVQERTYSEEEVLDLLEKGRYSNYNSLTTKEWFEQFKKKPK